MKHYIEKKDMDKTLETLGYKKEDKVKHYMEKEEMEKTVEEIGSCVQKMFDRSQKRSNRKTFKELTETKP